MIDGNPVDIATARTENYARPGSLPEVTPGSLQEDLIRRDFTINAMAIAIEGDAELIDPFGGLRDLESGVLRVLHASPSSTTRPGRCRAARYAARFGFDLEPMTAELLLATNTGSVSRERIDNELLLIAREETALEALRLARVWGLVDFEEDRLDLAERAVELTEIEPWAGDVPRETVVLEAVFGDLEGLGSLAGRARQRLERPPDRKSAQAARADSGTGPGAEWLDRWQRDWRWVELEITGADLLAAGVPEGPKVGEGLDAAMAAKLDRGVSGEAAEMAVALEAAGIRNA